MGPPNFAGPTSQGPPNGRFIYIDIGKSAGQFDSCWQRRIKIPLETITLDMIDSYWKDEEIILQAYHSWNWQGWRTKLRYRKAD